MMQNETSDENVSTNKNIRTVEIEQGSQTAPYPSLEKNETIQSAQSTFGADISDDDEVSDVGSFIMDHDIDEEDQDIEPKFLLPTEGMEASNIPSIDPETHARLEALLEAAGIGKLSTADGKALTDPEVLRKLTSSVSCALDEAAQALHRMRAEQQGQLTGAEGSRSLAEACSDGDVPTVRKLLHEGGSVHETTEEGESLLSLACSAGYYELAQVLLAMKANVEDRGIKGDCTPLMEAASGGYVDIVKLLIAHEADVNAQSSAGNTPLHYAACGGFEDVVQELLEAGANVEQHNENGHTPLMESASAGHVGVARILLRAGAGINTHSNEFKESALTLACYKGHLEMVKFLLEAGADQEHKTDEMHTALMEASMDGHVEVARLLLDSGAQVNMPADSFESPLTLAACGGHVDLAALLIERGANLEEVNDEGYTPLMEAAREGHEEMVGLLLANGAYINAQTEETQETGLTLACCGGFLEVADFLIKAGANIELGCSTPLMEAAQEGHLDLVRYLLKAGANVHATTGTGDTALTYACENGHTDVAEALLEHGAELEHESEGGRTPLMKAARAGYLCTVQFLISKGADVNRATSTNDHTVLSLACAGGHLAVVELLLAHGADPAHKLKDGSTMIIEAAKGGHTQVVKLLLEYPNRVLMNSPESALVPSETNIPESRVPVQGLGNIVPPSDPNSPSQNNIASLQTVAQNVIKSASEKDSNFPPRNPDQVWKNLPKPGGKRNHNNSGGDSASKPSKTSNIPPPPPPPATTPQYGDGAPTPPQYGDMGSLSDEALDVKASERLEAIINNVMAKELDSSSATREEQILRKQQILHELQKVEKELQEKAQAQLFLSAQHQLEQQQQQQHLQHVLQQGAKVLQRTLEVQVKIKQEENNGEGSSAEEKVEGESPASPQPSNDLDKQVTSLLPADVAASGQIVFPNIPYDSNLLPASSSQPVSMPSPASSEASTPKEGKDWPRNNGNTPKRGVSGKGGNRTKTPSSSAPTTPTGISVPTTVTAADQNKVTQSSQQLAQASAGIQSPANNNSAVALATYRQQIQNIVLRHQQQQQLQLQQQNPQQQQNQSQQTIQFPQLPQLQLTPEQQEHLLTMLSQQTFQPQITNPAIPNQQLPQQLPQQVPQQQFSQQPMVQQPLQLIQPPPQPPMTQQQQQQLLQQQQQAQILTQQLQQQIKPPQPAPPQTTNGQKNARNKRHLYNNQQQAAGNGNVQNVETITPPSSTPLTPNPSPASPQSISPLCTPDLDAQTESNHDTALTLACHGGHSELVNLLLSKGADIEHRDKKGFTPLILAATAGHVDVVEILLESGADMEAQSERTKDTPLSLACSGGRYEVVELLLSKGANKEHRNVSDYTPLSLAASGGYVNIIKLLLSHGAEINSRTGSKLGISPLMLAAMNGHTAAVKLLLDMGSDINAQIETNRNTALTLACFQGRHEVVSLLVDRKANIEHRAKTGLTPLMEAASGGYVEVGRVLLDKGADVNAPPVPSSRDTALTIAADKGHYRFVELLLSRHAAVDVKNKKGNSPLWLACNGGHLDVVQLLVSAGADIDSQDNRKVSCLMASFRKGHVKVSKWMVKHVNQFPSDQELSRYIATVSDKELQKKCQQCMEIIVSAKDRQAAEAFKNANILLEELDKERQHEENRKAAAAKKRERKKKKKKEKQQEKDVKDVDEEDDTNSNSKNSTPEPENCMSDIYQPDKEEKIDLDERIPMQPPTATVVSTIGTLLPSASEPTYSKSGRNKNNNRIAETSTISSAESRKNKRNRKEKERVSDVENVPVSVATSMSLNATTTSNHLAGQNDNVGRRKKGDNSASSAFGSGIGDLDDFGTLPENLKISDREVEKLRKTVEKTKPDKSDHVLHVNKQNGENVSPSVHGLHVKTTPVIASPKKGQKKEDGWKEVVRRPVSCKSKKVQVPSSAISRVIGRGGCNINLIREVSGAHIEVEKQRGSGERVITIKGTVDGTKQAHTLISALIADPDKDLQELIPKSKNKTSTKDQSMFFNPETVMPPASTHGQTSTSTTKTTSSTRNMGPRGQNQSSSARPQTTVSSSVPSSSMVWGGPPSQPPITSPRRSQPKQATVIQPGQGNPDKNVTRQLFPNETKNRGGFGVPPSTSSNTTVSYTLASSTSKVTTSGSPVFTIKPDNSKQPLPSKPGQIRPPVPGNVKVLQRPGSHKQDPQPLPIISGQQNGPSAPPMMGPNGPFMPPNSPGGSFSPFNNLFSNVADQLLKKDDASERMNFASVAAAGVIGSLTNSSAASDLMATKVDPHLQAKAPGFRPVRNPSPHEMEMRFKGIQLPPQMMNELDSRMFRTGLPNQSPSMSPRSSTSTPNTNMSPRNQTNTSLDPGHLSSAVGQKEEYTTPSQPMTLPKIESTLNPNAPDFTSRQAGGGPPNHPGGNVPPNNLAMGYLLYQQALAQQLQNLGGPGPNLLSPGMISQQEFANLIHQFVASGQAQPPAGSSPPVGVPTSGNTVPSGLGVPGQAPAPPRPFSPLTQGRPSSAPLMGGMPRDGSSPGPIGPPPPAASPLTVSPKLSDQIKSEDRRPVGPIGGERPMGPIGGERAQRRAPGPIPAQPISAANDFGPAFWNIATELSMQWGPVSSASSIHDSSSSVITSSEGGVPSLKNQTDFLEGRDLSDQQMDKVLHGTSVGMEYYGKGIGPGGGGQFSMAQQNFIPGPVGDGMPNNMWNPQMKGQVSEASDKVMWNSWSSQTSM